MDVADVKRLKTLEDENARLKKLLACGLIGLARPGLRYELRPPAKDAPVIAA